MQNWLARVGFPVRDFTVDYGNFDHGGLAAPGKITINEAALRGPLEQVAGRLGKRGRLSFDQTTALGTMMHEALHQMRYGRTPEFYDGHQNMGSPGWYEEGAAEAITQDLLPIFTAKMYGHRLNGPGRFPNQTAYPGAVNNVRQLSTFGSGAKKFTDRKARVWRRTFLHSDADERQRMIQSATSARAEWGKRTGR